MADKRDPEIPMDDPEIEALMALLEEETSDAVAPPPAAAAPVATPAPAPAAAGEINIDEAELKALVKAQHEKAIGLVEAIPEEALEAMGTTREAMREHAEKMAPPELPPEAFKSGKVTVDEKIADIVATAAKTAPQESNFVVPQNIKAAADPLPWEDDPSVGAPAPAPVVAAKPVLSVVPPAAPAATPAPAAVDDGFKGTPENPLPKKAPVSLNHGIDVAVFKAETSISPTNLDDAMMQQSSLRATYGELAARAEAQADRVKIQVEVKEAELYDKHRKLLAGSGEKVTEKAVENAVKLDPTWRAIKNRQIEAETIAAINKSLVASLNDRRDMMIQLGADRREEGKGQLRVLEREDLRQRALDAMSKR